LSSVWNYFLVKSESYIIYILKWSYWRPCHLFTHFIVFWCVKSKGRSFSWEEVGRNLWVSWDIYGANRLFKKIECFIRIVYSQVVEHVYRLSLGWWIYLFSNIFYSLLFNWKFLFFEFLFLFFGHLIDGRYSLARIFRD
jgi:ABC-type antimicrobial peptide transport system permease subunit